MHAFKKILTALQHVSFTKIRIRAGTWLKKYALFLRQRFEKVEEVGP